MSPYNFMTETIKYKINFYLKIFNKLKLTKTIEQG